MNIILAAFHPTLPSDLRQGLWHRKDLQLVHVRSLSELLEKVGQGAAMCLIGPQLGEHGAVAIVHAIREHKRGQGLPLVLVLHTPSHVAPGHFPLFDEVLEWPAKASSLPLLLARYVGLPIRTSERYPLALTVFTAPPTSASQTTPAAPDSYLGTTIDLSADGLLLRTRRSLSVKLGDRLYLKLHLPHASIETLLHGRVVRIEHETYSPDLGVAIRFDAADAERSSIREHLQGQASNRTFRWNIITEPDRLVIKLSGVLGADSDLTPLTRLRGQLDFYMSDFRRISSDSIQSWVELMRSLTAVTPARPLPLASRIRLHECPIAFVQQANAISNLLDHTEVVSFFAPYQCSRCGLDEEQLIVVDRDLRDAQNQLHRRAPSPPCTRCAGSMQLDDIPERYFMFL